MVPPDPRQWSLVRERSNPDVEAPKRKQLVEPSTPNRLFFEHPPSNSPVEAATADQLSEPSTPPNPHPEHATSNPPVGVPAGCWDHSFSVEEDSSASEPRAPSIRLRTPWTIGSCLRKLRSRYRMGNLGGMLRARWRYRRSGFRLGHGHVRCSVVVVGGWLLGCRTVCC